MEDLQCLLHPVFATHVSHHALATPASHRVRVRIYCAFARMSNRIRYKNVSASSK